MQPGRVSAKSRLRRRKVLCKVSRAMKFGRAHAWRQFFFRDSF